MTRDAGDTATALGAADWLCLAAAPTFAAMAVLTALGGGPADILCSAAQGASQLGGMAPMYALMSAFHAAPWVRLIAGKRGGVDRASVLPRCCAPLTGRIGPRLPLPPRSPG